METAIGLYCDNDPKVSAASIEIHTGRKWNTTRELERAETRLRHAAVVRAVVIGRTGLGSFLTPQYNKVQGKERRLLVQEEVRAAVEEARTSDMADMWQQGA